jgi:hypothetical protein
MIVERIFRDHGAELAVNSRKSHGTDFVIRFPRGGRRMRLLPAPDEGGGSDILENSPAVKLSNPTESVKK